MTLVVTTFVGVVFGFFLAITFPPISFNNKACWLLNIYNLLPLDYYNIAWTIITVDKEYWLFSLF